MIKENVIISLTTSKNRAFLNKKWWSFIQAYIAEVKTGVVQTYGGKVVSTSFLRSNGSGFVQGDFGEGSSRGHEISYGCFPRQRNDVVKKATNNMGNNVSPNIVSGASRCETQFFPYKYTVSFSYFFFSPHIQE